LSAFFISTVLNFSIMSSAHASTATKKPCSLTDSETADETVTVSRVYDGDTVKLSDGRKLRLIGINTPEMGSSDRQPEPFAQLATRFVRARMKESNIVQIRYGVQKKDRYGRLLVHIFLKDKRNLNALMLEQGLARTLHVPPNNWQFHCYDNLDKQAQRLKTGLWSNPQFQTSKIKTLKPIKNYKSSFKQINGVVSRIGDSKKNIWINLGSRFAIRINKSSLHYFNNIKFDALIGKKITARGYVVYYPKKQQFRMLVRHPIALSILN